MKIIFKKETIHLLGEVEAIYPLKELNAEKIMELLESCIRFEEVLEFVEEDNNSPISHKLKELIENGLSQSKETSSE